jgi:hypothetical protein
VERIFRDEATPPEKAVKLGDILDKLYKAKQEVDARKLDKFKTAEQLKEIVGKVKSG